MRGGYCLVEEDEDICHINNQRSKNRSYRYLRSSKLRKKYNSPKSSPDRDHPAKKRSSHRRSISKSPSRFKRSRTPDCRKSVSGRSRSPDCQMPRSRHDQAKSPDNRTSRHQRSSNHPPTSSPSDAQAAPSVSRASSVASHRSEIRPNSSQVLPGLPRPPTTSAVHNVAMPAGAAVTQQAAHPGPSSSNYRLVSTNTGSGVVSAPVAQNLSKTVKGSLIPPFRSNTPAYGPNGNTDVSFSAAQKLSTPNLTQTKYGLSATARLLQDIQKMSASRLALTSPITGHIRTNASKPQQSAVTSSVTGQAAHNSTTSQSSSQYLSKTTPSSSGQQSQASALNTPNQTVGPPAHNPSQHQVPSALSNVPPAVSKVQRPSQNPAMYLPAYASPATGPNVPSSSSYPAIPGPSTAPPYPNMVMPLPVGNNPMEPNPMSFPICKLVSTREGVTISYNGVTCQVNPYGQLIARTSTPPGPIQSFNSKTTVSNAVIAQSSTAVSSASVKQDRPVTRSEAKRQTVTGSQEASNPGTSATAGQPGSEVKRRKMSDPDPHPEFSEDEYEEAASDVDSNFAREEPQDAGGRGNRQDHGNHGDHHHSDESDMSGYEQDEDDDPQYESDVPEDDGNDGNNNDDKKDDSSNGEGSSNEDKDSDEFTDDIRAQSCMDGLYQLYQSGEMCDITLLVNDQQFKCHKNVLVASSDFFRTMFTADLAEKNQTEVRINSASPSVMEVVLKYLYTGKALLSKEMVQDLLAAADFFNLEDLKMGCARFMDKSMDSSNAIGIYFLAEAHTCEDLQVSARFRISNCFGEVCTTTDFLDLNADSMEEVLSWDRIEMDEHSLFEAALAWLEHDPDNRKPHIYRVFSQVRYALILQDNRFYFYDKIMGNRLVMSEPKMKELMDEIICYNTLKERWIEFDFRMDPRAGKVIRTVVSTARYSHLDGARLRTLNYYTDRSNSGIDVNVEHPSAWNLSTAYDAILVWAYDRLYFVGGRLEDDDSLTNYLDCWNLTKVDFEQMNCMNFAREKLPVVQVDAMLYAVGGLNECGAALDSVECYDIPENHWKMISPLPKPLSASCAVGYEGVLYVFGGESFYLQKKRKTHYHISNDVFCYSGKGDKWKALPGMAQARAWGGCTILNKKIYVIGGGFRESRSKSKVARPLESVEIFDPRTETWSQGPELPVPLMFPGVVKFRGTIYVLGGRYENAPSNSVYYLDKKNNTWQQSDDIYDNIETSIHPDSVVKCTYTVVDMPCKGQGATPYSDSLDGPASPSNNESDEDRW